MRDDEATRASEVLGQRKEHPVETLNGRFRQRLRRMRRTRPERMGHTLRRLLRRTEQVLSKRTAGCNSRR